jgi:hypothetical protein
MIDRIAIMTCGLLRVVDEFADTVLICTNSNDHFLHNHLSLLL